MDVNTLLRVALDSAVVGTGTRDLLILSPNHSAIKPHGHP